MRPKFAWVLAALLAFALTFAAAAQDGPTPNPDDDNACDEGGSLEGKCDWPTDEEDAWAWTCGWYIAQFENGAIVLSEVPEWCNYGAAPATLCYNSSAPGQRDFSLIGALNSEGNAGGYETYDGICAGPVVQADTIVLATSESGAITKCVNLNPAFNFAVNLRSALGYGTAPTNWWGCAAQLATRQ